MSLTDDFCWFHIASFIFNELNPPIRSAIIRLSYNFNTYPKVVNIIMTVAADTKCVWDLDLRKKIIYESLLTTLEASSIFLRQVVQ